MSKYWKEIYRQSLEKVRERFGIKGDFIKLVVTVILVLFAIGLLFGIGLLRGYETIFNVLIGLFATDIVALFALWLASPVIAIINMFGLVARRDKEQIERLQDLEGELIPADIVIEEVEVYMSKRVSIKIYNNELSKDLTELRVEIKRLAWFFPSGEPVEFAERIEKTSFLVENEQATIGYGSAKLINIAEDRGDTIAFLSRSEFLNDFFMGKTVNDGLRIGIYQIEIDIKGKLDGKPMKPKRFIGRILHWKRDTAIDSIENGVEKLKTVSNIQWIKDKDVLHHSLSPK